MSSHRGIAVMATLTLTLGVAACTSDGPDPGPSPTTATSSASARPTTDAPFAATGGTDPGAEAIALDGAGVVDIEWKLEQGADEADPAVLTARRFATLIELVAIDPDWHERRAQLAATVGTAGAFSKDAYPLLDYPLRKVAQTGPERYLVSAPTGSQQEAHVRLCVDLTNRTTEGRTAEEFNYGTSVMDLTLAPVDDIWKVTGYQLYSPAKTSGEGVDSAFNQRCEAFARA
jgi:hypothetical protein